MRVAIVGASGYTGLELVRIVLRHPNFELVAVTSEQRAGMAAGDAFPSLRGALDLAFQSNDPERLVGNVDLAFTALPHAASAPTVRALREAGIPVLDLSADFRLRSLEVYAAWYGEHAAPELLGSAVYGLPEVYREALRTASLVAVPGCYPTSVLLPLLPFLRAGLVEPTGLVVDSKSGVSGSRSGGRRETVAPAQYVRGEVRYFRTRSDIHVESGAEHQEIETVFAVARPDRDLAVFHAAGRPGAAEMELEVGV